jgi:hypothetical protein
MKRDEFEKNIMQLLSLLKKILKNHPQEDAQMANLFEPKQMEKMVLNLCFFNFIPMTPEELSELEEAYEEALEKQAGGSDFCREADDFNWNENDIEFLKRHGIRLSTN